MVADQEYCLLGFARSSHYFYFRAKLCNFLLQVLQTAQLIIYQYRLQRFPYLNCLYQDVHLCSKRIIIFIKQISNNYAAACIMFTIKNINTLFSDSKPYTFMMRFVLLIVVG